MPQRRLGYDCVEGPRVQCSYPRRFRWFWQDECPANLRCWFTEALPAAGGGELRIDQYLLLTDESEISIKRRCENPE
jgi:hypothetical protein